MENVREDALYFEYITLILSTIHIRAPKTFQPGTHSGDHKNLHKYINTKISLRPTRIVSCQDLLLFVRLATQVGPNRIPLMSGDALHHYVRVPWAENDVFIGWLTPRPFLLVRRSRTKLLGDN